MDAASLPMEDRVRQLTDNYTSEALVYEQTWAAGLRDMGRKLLEAMDIAHARVVLDIGAGVGALLPDVAELAPNALVVGCDRSPGMIARAAPRFGRAVMDATGLAVQPGRVDAATMAFCLFHIPEPVEALAEARRVLRPGGSIGTSTWGVDETWPALGIWAEELDAHGAIASGALLSQHELVDTTDKIAELLDRAGFEHVRAWEETLTRRFDAASLIQFTTGMAICKRRLDSLDDEARDRFLEVATERINRLQPEAFLLTSEVVMATATNPGG